MIECLEELGNINPELILKAKELSEKENELGNHGIEKEFAFVKLIDLSTCQKIGKYSAYKFLMDYGGIPQWMRKRTTPEVFDYMIEIITEPRNSYERAVLEILHEEAILWKALLAIRDNFNDIDEIALNTGTLLRPAKIESENICEVWGRDKKTYLEQMVNRYGKRLTPQGMHGNLSIPEPLIAYQYNKISKKSKRGSIGYVEFKNELYVNLARRMRPFVSLLIAIEANSPFDYVIENGNDHTVLTGYQSNRWLKLPCIESTNYPLMLKDYEHFQKISGRLISSGIIIGANNYMPVRPKGERRLGEVPLSLEMAAWFCDIVLDENKIAKESLLFNLAALGNVPFVTRLKLAERAGFLKTRNLSFQKIIEIWQKENVRRLLGVPLNRIEIRSEEAGGEYEFELAKAAFRETILLYLFSNPAYGHGFKYNRADLSKICLNEKRAVKEGLDSTIIHPFSEKEIKMRDFLKEILFLIEPFARGINSFNHLEPICELSKGKRNEAEKTIHEVSEFVDKNSKKTKKGLIIVPTEFLKEKLMARRNYILNNLAPRFNFDMRLSKIEN